MIGFEDASGRSRGGLVIALDDRGGAVEGDITDVMVRLKAPELEIVGTLITAGIANGRAEASWRALARISERPAYAQLREHCWDAADRRARLCFVIPAASVPCSRGGNGYSSSICATMTV